MLLWQSGMQIKGVHKQAYRHHRDNFRALKTADKVTNSGKLPNKPIVTPVCFDGKQTEMKDWLSQFENCRTINLWSDDQCVKILQTFFKAQALQL